MIRWMKVASVVLALGATTSGVAALAQKGTSGDEPGPEGDAKAARADDVPVSVVKPGKLTGHRGRARVPGVVPATRMWSARSRGRRPSSSILPEGTRVKKGELVGELDSSVLKDKLVNQKITAQGAEAAYLNAKLAREVAEIAVNEYREGIYKQEMQTAMGEIALAESALKRAEDRLERTASP